MAFELGRAGIHSFEIFERADRVGGVWRENTYPGAGCDVPSPFYSFSYEPNPTWPQRFSLQEPILEYLEHCVRKYGVADRLHLECEVTAAHFDAHRNVWELTVNGVKHEADVLVCACGQLSEPAYPRVEGIETFAGHSFHSAQWDHAYDLAGRTVAVIGTGASAIQFVPKIATRVARLHLFQRSAPYVLPKPDRQYDKRHHGAFARFPALLAAERLSWYLFCEYATKCITRHPSWMRPWRRLWRWDLHRQVRDPVKRAALTPDYELGCKRTLFSSDYYPALARENVQILPEGISAVTESGVISESGQVCDVDTIIYATGFHAHGFVAPMEIRGCGHRSLVADAWRDGASAYLGMTVPDFPNMFLLYGPNTNLGSGSIVYMEESAARYVTDAVRHLAQCGGGAFDVRPETHDTYDREIQRRLTQTVWATGCHSWYIDESGTIATTGPGR